MKSIFALFAVVLTLSVPNQVFACSCLPFGNSFFETVFLHNQKIETGEWSSKMDLTIIVGEIDHYVDAAQEKGPTDFVVNVLGSIQGNSCAKQITVKGGDGASCEVPAQSFLEGKRYLLAMMQNESGEFFVSLCGNYSHEVASAHSIK